MPYVKYFGGRPPASIKEQVFHEDRNAPCREGLAKLSADARLFAEDTYSDPIERASAINHYLDTHSYPGLRHLGGVGFVDDTLAPAVGEVIGQEEYHRLRQEIETANQNARIRKEEELAKNNDPSRRAAPEHEKLGWRTRVWVTSYTELEHHTPYPLGERSVAYLRVRNYTTTGSTTQLIDIYHSSEGGIEQAILEGTDWAEVLVDLLALAGYGAAHMEKVLGTTVPFCSIGEPFQLATFNADIVNTPVPVQPGQLQAVHLDPAARLELRHLRDGLSAPLPTVAFAAFWNALERYAEEEARTNDFQRVVKCERCGAERAAGWDIKGSFETMYTKAGLEVSLFDQHRSTRGTIQHGGKLRTTAYMDEVRREVSQVQTVAMVAVAGRMGIAPSTMIFLSTSWPVVVFALRADESGDVTGQVERVQVAVTPGILPQRICGDAARVVRAGVSMPPNIDRLALPPLQRS